MKHLPYISEIYPTTLDRLSNCKLNFYWNLFYEPRFVAPHLSFGSAIHYALEKYYSEGSNPVVAFMNYGRETDITLDIELGRAMLNNYLDEYHNKERFEILCTESTLTRRVPFPSDEDKLPVDFNVSARLDAIVKQDGKIFVLEHKTFDRFYSNSLFSSHQFALEQWVAGSKYAEISGVIYNGLRKTKTASKGTNPFERHTIFINKRQLRLALKRVYWTLKFVNSPQFRVFPEPGPMKCSMCEFKSPCAEYVKGGDYEYILEVMFNKKEKTIEREE